MQGKTKVTIELVGLQYIDGECNRTTSRIEGEYVNRNETGYLFYQEIMEGVDVPTKCTLKMKDGVISLSRKGEASVTMTFEKGRSHKTGYITPYGTMSMEITTKEMDIVHKENGMQVFLKYRLDMEEQYLSDHEMHITVTEK